MAEKLSPEDKARVLRVFGGLLAAAVEKLDPQDEARVQGVLETYPQLTREEAIEMLKAFGGL